MMRYWPVPSVTVERVFSISAGLAASTVTPGRTAPDGSRTVPVNDACARAEVGSNRTPKIARHFLAVRMGFFPPNRLDQLTGRGEEYRDFVRETRKIIACGTTFARGSAKPDTTHFGATDLPFAFRIRPVMKASVRFRRGHAWYSGAISRTTFLAWLETPEGRAAVDDAASRIRFVFLAKYRAARALWRRLVAAARDPHVVVTIQSEMDAYLGRVHELAYSGGLPRLRVDLHRIVVVPRVLINGAAYGAIARRLRSERAFASLEGGDAIRDFFIRTL